MVGNLHVYATLPAADLERAKRFYSDKLGLTPAREDADGVFYHCGGDTQLYIFATQGAASGGFTQAGWVTDDLEAEVSELKARGVTFEEYDAPDLRTVNSIATTGSSKAAWFKDSEGNLLGLIQYA